MRLHKRIIENSKIILNQPVIIPKLIENYSKIVVGKKPLRTVEIALSYDCQLDCEHCSAKDLVKDEKELTEEQIIKVIDESKKLGAIHILLTGGETLMQHDKLFTLLNYCKNKFITSIDTNGLLLGEGYANDLKKAGLDVACVSLDYASASKHDAFRKKEGCFDKAIQGIKNCRKAGIRVIISTFVTKEKLYNNELTNILKLAEDLDSSVIFCLPVLTGNYKDQNACLGDDDYKQLKCIMEHPLARLCEENNYLFKGCSAGSEKIAISAYGEVMPCSFIKKSFGNVKDDSLSDILKKMRGVKEYSKVNRKTKCLAAIKMNSKDN